MILTAGQRDKLVKDLATAREDLHKHEARYYTIAPEIQADDTAAFNLRSRVRNAQERKGDYHNAKPRHFDYLPDDPECVSWAARYQQLEAEEQQLSDELRALSTGVEERRQEAIKLQGLIFQGQYAERNLLSALERDDEERNPKIQLSGVH
jgi:predicted  nucleic acid-binding Zn-ribbon protein